MKNGSAWRTIWRALTLDAKVSKIAKLEQPGRQAVTALWEECKGIRESVSSARTFGSELIMDVRHRAEDDYEHP